MNVIRIIISNLKLQYNFIIILGIPKYIQFNTPGIYDKESRYLLRYNNNTESMSQARLMFILLVLITKPNNYHLVDKLQ